MPRTVIIQISIVVVICFGALDVSAWDDVGHKITGYIAWQRMSPAARENVIKTLRAAPEDSHLSAFYMAYGPESDEIRKREYFMLVPTWADIVRDRAFPVRYDKYHKSTWHYADTFWRQVNGRAEIITDKKPGGQGVVKLVEFDKVIRDPAVSDADKAIAIAWLMHIGGDLHQPLHTSGRHTDREPDGDLGGNRFLLSPEGGPRADEVNLHWYWDSIVGRNIPIGEAQCERDYVEFVARSMMNRHTFDDMKGKLKLGNYDAWRQESFELAPTDVFPETLKRFEMPTDEYRRNAFRVSEQQLVLAGYRLGETLEQAFGAKTAAAAECRVIRKIMYPVFKLHTPENIAKSKPTLAALNTCPTGPASRPTIEIELMGVKTFRSFDVVKVFESEAEARAYANQNSIKDISFEIQ